MFALNISEILKQQETPAFLKEIVRDYQSNGQVTVGGWIKTAATLDLLSTMTAINGIIAEKHSEGQMLGQYPPKAIGSVLTVVDVFSLGEGLDIKPDTRPTAKRLMLLESYVAMELLKRRGFDMRLHYENMSMNEEYDETSDRPIVDSSAEDCKLGEQLKYLASKTGVSMLNEIPGFLAKGKRSGNYSEASASAEEMDDVTDEDQESDDQKPSQSIWDRARSLFKKP